MGPSGQGGAGAFFDNLTLEVSVGAAVPYVLNGNHDDKVDLIFMPDQTYKHDFKKFFKQLSDILTVLSNITRYLRTTKRSSTSTI